MVTDSKIVVVPDTGGTRPCIECPQCLGLQLLFIVGIECISLETAVGCNGIEPEKVLAVCHYNQQSGVWSYPCLWSIITIGYYCPDLETDVQSSLNH